MFLARFSAVDAWNPPPGWTVVNGLDVCPIVDVLHDVARKPVSLPVDGGPSVKPKG